MRMLNDDICPICLDKFKRREKVFIKINNKRIYFCSSECLNAYLLEQRRLERLGLKNAKRKIR